MKISPIVFIFLVIGLVGLVVKDNYEIKNLKELLRSYK